MGDEGEFEPVETVKFVEVHFEDGPLGVTLRRNVETGTIHVFEVLEDSQAADGMDVQTGDELWSVGSVGLSGNYMDKEAWEGLIQFIRDSDRPLKVVWKRRTRETGNGPQIDIPASQVSQTADIQSSGSPKNDDKEHEENEEEQSHSDSSSSKATADGFDELGLPEIHGGLIEEASGKGQDTSPSPSPSPTSHSEATELTELKNLLQTLVFTEPAAGQPVKKFGRRITSFFSKSTPNVNTNDHRDANSLLKAGRSVLKVEELMVRSKPPSTMTHHPAPKATTPYKTHQVALLTDIIIISSQMYHMTQRVIDHVIELRTCKLRSNGQIFGGDPRSDKDEENPDFIFEILWPGGALELNAESKEMREVWVLNIHLAVCECIGPDERTLGWRHQFMLGTMHSAVLTKDEARVKELLHLCESRYLDFLAIDGTDQDGYTPLHYASILGMHGIMSLLYDATADITAMDCHGYTPLHWAAIRLDDYALSVLSSTLIDADVADQHGRTPLYLACVEGRCDGRCDPEKLRDCLSVLLTHQPEVNGTDARGYTLLQYLASEWQNEAVEQLLAAGADVMAMEADSMNTALHFSARALNLKRGRGEGSRKLREMGVLDGSRTSASTSKSSKSSAGMIGSVKSTSTDDYDLDSVNISEKPNGSVVSLNIPSSLNRSFAGPTMQALLRAGALPNHKDKQGQTAVEVLMETYLEQKLKEQPLDGEEAPRKSVGLDDIVIEGEDESSDKDEEEEEESQKEKTAVCESRSGWYENEVLDAVTVLICHGARVDEASPIATSFRNKLPALRIAALTEKWNAKPVISDLIDVKIKQWEFENTAPFDTDQANPNAADTHCRLCGVHFTFFKFAYHCKICDVVCCDDCSKRRCIAEATSQRTCDCCYNRLSDSWETASQRAMAQRQRERSESNSSGTSTDRAQKDLLFGSKYPPPTTSPVSSVDHSSVQATMATMNETQEALQRRGEKLAQTAQKAQKVSDNANEFAKLAKQLADQKKKSWF